MLFLLSIVISIFCSSGSLTEAVVHAPFKVLGSYVQYPVQSFLISGNDGSHLMVDCGDQGDYDQVKEIFQTHEIRYLVVTHAHGDHTGCLKRIKEDFGDKVKIIAHVEEEEYLVKGTPSRTEPYGIVPSLICVPLFALINYVVGYDRLADEKIAVQPDILFPKESEFTEDLKNELRSIYGVELLHTKGHTEGSISVYNHESEEIIVGDMFANFGTTSGFGYHFFVQDMDELLESWKMILKMKPLRIFASHYLGAVTPEELMEALGIDEKDVFGDDL